jgi:Voltage gated chloride channel
MPYCTSIAPGDAIEVLGGVAPDLPNTDRLPTLLVLGAGKILACSTTLGMGGSGGVFAPSLFIGVTSGMAFGVIISHLIGAAAGPPALYAVVAMGAVFTADARAPLTSVASVVEMTGDYTLTPPRGWPACSPSATSASWPPGTSARPTTTSAPPPVSRRKPASAAAKPSPASPPARHNSRSLPCPSHQHRQPPHLPRHHGDPARPDPEIMGAESPPGWR